MNNNNVKLCKRIIRKDVSKSLMNILKINKYIMIENLVMNTNVLSDKKIQKMYNGFYNISKKSKKWYNAYYTVFEKMKKAKKLSIDIILNEIEKQTHTVEFSFASKMLHTINNKYPIFDENVRKALGLSKVFGKTNAEKIKSAVEIYKLLMTEHKKYYYLADIFDDILPDVKISKTKKIDYILYWLGKSIK